LAKAWDVPEQEVPRRAIQEMSMHEALTEGVQKLKQKPSKAGGKASPQHKTDKQAEETSRLRDENAGVRQELEALKRSHKALEARLEKVKIAVSRVAETLNRDSIQGDV
jgi:hypothetical protein